MTLVGILAMIVFGGVAGWLASLIMRGEGLGVIGNVVVGILGSVIGNTIFWLIGFVAVGLIAKIIVAVIGAVALLWIVGLLRKRL